PSPAAYTLALHDALPISLQLLRPAGAQGAHVRRRLRDHDQAQPVGHELGHRHGDPGRGAGARPDRGGEAVGAAPRGRPGTPADPAGRASPLPAPVTMLEVDMHAPGTRPLRPSPPRSPATSCRLPALAVPIALVASLAACSSFGSAG